LRLPDRIRRIWSSHRCPRANPPAESPAEPGKVKTKRKKPVFQKVKKSRMNLKKKMEERQKLAPYTSTSTRFKSVLITMQTRRGRQQRGGHSRGRGGGMTTSLHKIDSLFLFRVPTTSCSLLFRVPTTSRASTSFCALRMLLKSGKLLRVQSRLHHI
jgi:hypothetical protein